MQYLCMSLGFGMQENKQLEQKKQFIFGRKTDEYSRVPQRKSVYVEGQVLKTNTDCFQYRGK